MVTEYGFSEKVGPQKLTVRSLALLTARFKCCVHCR